MLEIRLNPDILTQANQAHSYSFYQRITLADFTAGGNGPYTFTKEIPADYYYHLNGIRSEYQTFSNQEYSPKIEVFEIIRGREFQNKAYPLNLISTPAGVQQSPNLMPKLRKTYLSHLNILFQPLSVLKFTISIAQGAGFPDNLDIMTDGFRVPIDYRYEK